jgi:hypothetical protein
MGDTAMRCNYSSRLLVMAVVLAGLLGAPLAPSQDGKPDPAWNKDSVDIEKLPSAFPDIKPISEQKDILESLKKRTPVILDTDPVIRKLQKAKLRNAAQAFVLNLAGDIEENFADREARLIRIDNSNREMVTTGLELAADDSERRIWLVFAVAIRKGIEQHALNLAKVGAIFRQTALTLQHRRLDAEIALLRHDQRK